MDILWAPWRLEYILGPKPDRCVFCLPDHTDEDDHYFNLPRQQRTVYMDLFGRHGVRAVFGGHYHRNSRGRTRSFDMIVSGPVGLPLGDDPSGLTVVLVDRDRLTCEYHPIVTSDEP